jgi:Coenzyme PQQ synthesis protein D (PqqD)
MPFELTTRVARFGELMSAPVDKEIVILSLASNHYVGLDDIGRRVWELLEAPRRMDELCQQLAGEFDATAEQIAADVLPFLVQLESEGLVHVAGE